MSKHLTELTIFISSPADLAAERQIIEAIVQELNLVLRTTKGIVLRVLTWDRDLLPGVASDPQMVINTQIQGQYDIYIGLVGARFGTKTPRAESGTEDEFEQAYKAYEDSPESLRVMFYFKTRSDRVQQINTTQLKKVIKFQKKLSKAGVLYSQFADEDQLLKLVRNHILHLVTEQWNGKNWVVLSSVDKLSSETGLTNLAESEALVRSSSILDSNTTSVHPAEPPEITAVVDDAVAEMRITLQALKKITAAIDRWVVARDRWLAKKKNQNDPSELKYAFDAYGTELLDFAESIKGEVSRYRSSFGEGLDLIDAAAIARGRFYGQDPSTFLIPLLPVLGIVETQMRDNRKFTEELRKNVSAISSKTETFKRSKRKVLQILAEFNASTTINLDKIERLRDKSVTKHS